ncbi:MAG: ClbS/DfsB family four-helix bundle protein [Chloroflexi bacterium]|nr:ClbS/DfsB family four-helix bundle protein [Chloroflexota bacterium]
MSNLKQRTINFLEIEWATYVKRFNRWPADEGEKRVKAQGYAQFRDMLAHILTWWEEAMPIILAIAEGRETERKKYDFDAFNAEAVAKYKDWDEAEFFAHFENMRVKTAADLRAMNDAAWENRRVRSWVNGVFIHHAREHLVALSRFLTADTLENEWSAYVDNFNNLDDEKKNEFLAKQGVETFHDMLAHVIGWWDEGTRIVSGILADPAFEWQDHDTDAFNAELIAKNKNIPDAEMLAQFESRRLGLLRLVNEIPERAFAHKDIEAWLAADVVGHYDEHNPANF